MRRRQIIADVGNLLFEDDESILSDPLTDELCTPELFFGLVGAIGTDLQKVSEILKRALKDEVDYETRVIKLSSIVTPAEHQEESDRYQRYLLKMQAGTDTRNFYDRADAVVLKGLNEVRALRREANAEETLPAETDPAELPADSMAFVFHSLKRKEEVDTLRRIYGESFYLIGAYSPRETRVVTLAEAIASSRHKQNTEQFRPQAEELIEKDRADHGERLGQAVQKTFPEADIFINIEDEDEAKAEITRFIRLIFSDAFFTPRKNEQAMFFARAAALRSADLGRQVGAVIISEEGDVLSIGTNEVPKALGGQYWEGDNPDKRDFKLRFDSNDKMKKTLIGDVASQLSSKIHETIREIVELSEQSKLSSEDIDTLIAKAASQAELTKSIEKSQIVNLIAYFRAMHGEMAALIGAARRGISVRGATLVCTTFPCHECARHIVAAGIKKVLYIEPYPKSLTVELYRDSVVVDSPQSNDTFVHFVPFVGVAPRQFMQLFDASRIERKDDGEVVDWDASMAKPRRSESPQAYVFKEKKRLHFLEVYDKKFGGKENG
ncbi:MAG: hypothetical protein K8F91_06995 [Candidatus Obscuribacterales bacterium]|nr:hypothetical protein [Candidatus Obscuribacterales bacterium]